MKVGPTTRAVLPAGLQHAVGFHRSAADLVARLAAAAAPPLRAGEPVVLALSPGVEQALRAALDRAGLDGGAPHTLPAPRGVEAASGQTVALRRARELRGLGGEPGGEPLTVLTEHLPELDGPDGRFWTELEAATQIALADLPVRLLCFYPEMPLHLSVLEGARATHPHLLADRELHPNPEHREPRELLTTRPAVAPALLGAPETRMTFQAWQLRDLRRTVRAELVAAGFDDDHADDVVLAVNEVATNAVEHGGADAELHLWTDGHRVTCEVHDGGPLRDPLPGLVAPHSGAARGRGLWIARQLCDLLHVWADGQGTHVRLSVTA